VEEYLREILDALLGKGIEAQVQAFRQGFSKVFAVTDMRMFSAEELSMLFGNADEDWTLESQWFSSLCCSIAYWMYSPHGSRQG
jgi:E3 ubiquitin-protein ligase TRIP12